MELAELIRQVFNLSPYRNGPTLLSSWMVWLDLPLATCAWAIWGRPGGVIDKIFGVAILLLAGLTATIAGATAILMVERANYEPPEGTVIDYLYIPEPSWIVYYVIMIAWFAALAMLLYRRQPKS